jgi:type I restriction enzyme S subunit
MDTSRAPARVPEALPQGWRWTPLTAICLPKQWPTLAKRALLAEGFPVFGANGVIGYAAEYTHAEATIAITCRGATSGAVHIVPPKTYITGNAMALDGISREIVAIDYLWYALRQRGLSDIVSGSAQPQITRAALASVHVPLPPLDEQRRIAAVLDAIGRSALATSAVIDQLERVKKALTLDLLTRGVPSRRNAAASAPRPEAWSVVKLGDVARVQGGYAFLSDHFSKRGVPVVRMSNLKRGALDLTGAVRVPERCVVGLERYALHEGDVLIGLSGSTGPTGSLGNYARVRRGDGDPRLYINQRVARLVIVDRRRLDPGFLFALVASEAFRVEVQGLSAALAQANVSPRQIEAIQIALPPLDEQIAIAAMIDAACARIAAEARAREGTRRLQAELMRALLSGERRVIG